MVFNNQFHYIMELFDNQYKAVKKSNPAAKVNNLNYPLIRTKNLIRLQINIILVGGLGSSPYLYNYVKLHYEAKKVKILQTAGSNVPNCAAVRAVFYRVHNFGTTVPFTIKLSFYNCKKPVAPMRKINAVKSINIIIFDSKINKNEYFQHINKMGKKYKQLDFEVEIVPQKASVEFGIYIGGRKLGAKNVNVRFQ
ncbi:hypothetical protein PoMZ_13484 [Pyricularia oryzae]|uniref:Uncharacterized protein n=1 Tax=Pyricularia oryzae TaxID=318829 RepID=A0A4P7NV71_PYROR|nr:hypothetical protein PoMZ_13484 [Pyricularia oryzae]